MAERGFSVAIVGAAGEIGRDLRLVLEERAFPVSEWHLCDDADAILAIDDPSESEPVRLVDDVEISSADIVFFCGPPEQAERLADTALGGAIAIDLTQGLAARSDVALIVPEVNADAVAAAIDDRMMASPLPATTALAVALAPIEHALRLRRVTVTCLEPVSSEVGGVRELARQTGELLGGHPVEPEVWQSRIAFNLIPHVGDFGPTGASDREWQIQSQVRAVLDLPDLPISAHVVRVPTFYGQGLVVNAETDEPVDLDGALALFRESPGLLLHEGEQDEATYPTLSDAVGSEATHIGRVREDPTVPCGITFWIAIDGLRKGTTVNAAQIAECVARELRERG